MYLTEEQQNLIGYSWFAVSLAGFIVWLWRSRGGFEAFQKAPPRPHKLKGFDVLAILLVFIAIEIARTYFLNQAEPHSPEKSDLSYIGLLGGQLVITAVILFLGRRRFTGGLGGFGLSLRHPGKTTGISILYFVMATGLTLLVLSVTVQICEAAGIEEQRHATLEKLSDHPPLRTMIILMVTAAIGAPVMEELLFRGILQSYFIRFFYGAATPVKPLGTSEDGGPPVRGATLYRWLGIVIASAFFMVTHANWQHMPALLVLGVCLGYIYERRGNILIPIMVHGLFNMMQLAGTLLQNNSGG
ncbi:MAG: hypothetical protein AMJ79_07115 [Phycisphaerae bacterium SM23_30]|nr:MAG: hypothetical protein AMJ79_07115 [Phycisphaerae bacterium SM23_30]